ncbi:uncharacterized protein LOC142356908 [Convolutriloba macropyga]|uniref:uncharacterized protein LOC142356908 n=1 Tax=Convolutriloba macropyga TaxID=536237 RepID=UPI003F51ACCC
MTLPVISKCVMSSQRDMRKFVRRETFPFYSQYLDMQPPLEKKKNRALQKLGFQGMVFEKILKFLTHQTAVQLFSDDAGVEELVPEICENENMKMFWETIDKPTLFLAPVGSLIRQLHRLYSHKFTPLITDPSFLSQGMELAAERLVGERSRDDKTNSVSVFTFYQTVSREYQGSVEVYVDKIVQEVALSSQLWNPNLQANTLPEILPQFAGHIPHPEIWKQIAQLLTESQSIKPELASKILDYFDSISDVVVRKKLTDVYLEQLEEIDAKEICSAAVCLTALRAANSLHQLAFLANHHEKQTVRGVCRDAAFSFGPQGRNVVQFYSNPINHLTQTQRKYKPTNRHALHATSESNINTVDLEDIVYL